MGNNKNTLESCLKQLHLSGIRNYYQELTQVAEKETMPYKEYLLELFVRECCKIFKRVEVAAREKL